MKKNKIFILFVLMIFIGISYYENLQLLVSYVTDRDKLEMFITSLGGWAPLTFIGIYIVLTLTTVSALPLTIVGGITFGPLMGITYTIIGAGIGLSCSFLIARYIAKESIEKNLEIHKFLKK